MLNRLLRIAVPMLLVLSVSAVGEARPASGPQVRQVTPMNLGDTRGTMRPPSDLPLGHWAYPLLERLVARGILDLDLTTRPVSRRAVATALNKRQSSAGASRDVPDLTKRETWALLRLSAEFLRGKVDRQTLGVRERKASVAVGIDLGTGILGEWGESREAASASGALLQSAEGVSSDDGVRPWIDASYELWGGVDGLFGVYSQTDIVLAGQDGPRIVELSERARSWRGITASAERAYVMVERPHFAVALGRRGPAWGRSTDGGLLISGNAPSFDQLDARFEVGSFAFHALHAMLEYRTIGTEEDLTADERVYMAGHRVVVRSQRASVGLSEVVVYGSHLPDPVYLNPLVPYYLAQHNERANDNIFWSLDFDWRTGGGTEVYGEFLVDDLMYERYSEHPDKYGFTLGSAYYGTIHGFDLELEAEYSHVRKWTYTHGFVEHRLEHDGVPVGFELGPDADRITLSATVHPSFPWALGVRYAHSRQGEGSIESPFENGESYEPEFPSGRVVETDRIAVTLDYANLAGRFGQLGTAYERVEGDDDWKVWISFGFRI